MPYGSDPGGQLCQTRIVELLLDTIMLLGIAVLCWVAMAAYGVLPAPPLIFDGVPEAQLEGRRVLTFVLAFVSILEYPVMLLMVRNARRKGSPATGVAAPLALRFAYSSAIWIYLGVLYYMLHSAG